MKSKFVKISYIFMALVVAGVILFNFVSVTVLAANEITSLPMIDVDVECTYDTDCVYMNHKERLYRLERSYSLKRVYPNIDYSEFLINYTVNGPYYDDLSGWQDFVPEFTDKESTGLMAPLSMWFSEQEMRVYCFTGTNTNYNNYGERGKIKSYYGSSFIFSTCSSFVALNYYDLSDGSFHPLGLISLQGNSKALYGVYPDMYVNATGGINAYKDENGASQFFPNDLLCIYSNYEISGYFEFGGEAGSLYTPNYYFAYQYIFYVEGVGYTFIDSARPLVDIVDNKDGYVYLDFSEVCNRRVWTSPDGYTWSYSNLASAMLGDLLQMPYKWFLDNVGGSVIAKLVYTTDLNYNEKPIIKPEYKDLIDVIESLKNSDLDYEVDKGTPDLGGPMDDTNFLWDLANKLWADAGLGSNVSGYFGIDEFTYSEFTQTYIFNSLTSLYMPMYDYNTGEYISDRITVLGALFGVYQNTFDNNLLLSNLQLNLHNDLKSVFDNISLSNYYLENLDSSLAALPDYSKKLDSILFALENISSKAPSSGNSSVFVDLSALQEYLIAIDDTSEIQELLLELDKSIDAVAKIEVFDEITDSSDIAGDVVDNVFDEVFDFENAPELSKGADEVSGMISGAIGQLATGSLLIGAFDYASNITSGVGYINANVNNIYQASSVMKPVFLSGAAMFVVNLVLRRRE